MGIPGIQLVLRSALGCKQKVTVLVLAHCLQDAGQQTTASSIQALGDEAAEMCPLISGPASRRAPTSNSGPEGLKVCQQAHTGVLLNPTRCSWASSSLLLCSVLD